MVPESASSVDEGAMTEFAPPASASNRAATVIYGVRDLQTLLDLEPAMLAQRADAVVASLENNPSDPSVVGDPADVRRMALRVLGKLDPATLAQHADALTCAGRHWRRWASWSRRRL